MYIFDVVIVGSIFAVQIADKPPLLPEHVQYHGPVPTRLKAVPVVQKTVVGGLIKTAPLLPPQAPFTTAVENVPEMK
jgi:hypothetical protein